MLRRFMAKKKLASNLVLTGIAPNLLLKEVENTAPFLFQGELKSDTPETAFIEKLRFYKKNLKALQHIDLTEYFHICMASHWSTAGTFVPTDVDNQIREKLWKHKDIKNHIKKMARITIDSWKWDYTQVTERKSYNPIDKSVISTHEGTWLSVAIGAYCALKKNKLLDLAEEVASVIVAEIDKERDLLLELQKERSHIAFIRTTPLVAHNLGDLDRVMVQWDMHESDEFCAKYFKLGHIPRGNDYDIFVFGGEVNKAFTSKENHRHMSMRKPKSIRKSHELLISVGPFMDDWGKRIGECTKIDLSEKAEIVAALFDGFNREKEAFGYARAFGNLLNSLPNGFLTLEPHLPFDLVAEIKKSEFSKISELSQDEFESSYIKSLDEFTGPVSNLKF